MVASASEVLEQIQDLVIVDAALNDGIDLDRREARAAGRRDASQHVLQLTKPTGHLRKGIRIQTVQADRDALQSRRTQCRGMLREQHAIGRQRDVLQVRQ
jgi:hypothetical protein